MNEPKIGDIRIKVYDNRYPSGNKQKQIYHACDGCGKWRWVYIKRGEPESKHCHSCASKLCATEEWQQRILEGSHKRWARKGERERMSKMYSGSGNPFHGKKHSQEVLDIMSRPRVDVEIRQTWDWGYLTGLVLGDGSLCKKNGGDYLVIVASTRPEIVDIFKWILAKLGLKCGSEKTTIKPRNRDGRFGAKSSGYNIRGVLHSKIVYEWLRPCKCRDSHFVIPKEVCSHKEMARGFLCGFFDAEGGIYKGDSKNSYSIDCWSKHKSNLEQVKRCLDLLGISSYIQVRTDKYLSRLIIAKYKDRVLYRELVGFRIKRKQDTLASMGKLEHITHNKDVKQYAIKLLKEGANYDSISLLTGVCKQTIAVWKFYLKNPNKRNERQSSNSVSF